MLELRDVTRDQERNSPDQPPQMIAATANPVARNDFQPILIAVNRQVAQIEVSLIEGSLGDANQRDQLRLQIPLLRNQLEQLTQSSEGTE
ncbi:hypothetical protein [Halochromatium sp.]